MSLRPALRLACFIVPALLTLLATLPASANNPILATSSGTPYKWNSPILYTVDGGGLGTLSNAEATQIVTEAFAAWTSVPTVSPALLSVSQNGSGLGPDGDIDTVAEYNALIPPQGSCSNI